MERAVVDTEDIYRESYAALGDSAEAAELVEALVSRIRYYADLGLRVPGRKYSFMKMRSWNGRIALRMYYWFNAETAYLLRVEPYDELDD